MSTTARYSIKPKTVTLLELCQSISDFRRPPPSITSYQYQSTPNAAQILTRRLYLHPLTIKPTAKRQPSKMPTIADTPPDSDHRHQLNFEEKHRSHRGLAILSSSFPLITRINTKIDPRQIRDKISINTDDDTNSDCDASAATIILNQPSLPAIARGTSSSTHTMCVRPSCLMNQQKAYSKWNNPRGKVNVWQHLDRSIGRPIPNDPPTTPLHMTSNFNIRNNSPTTSLDHFPSDVIIQNDEEQNEYLTYNSIQAIKIYKRNQVQNSVVDEYDDIYDEEYLM